jgi:hypothetical protein
LDKPANLLFRFRQFLKKIASILRSRLQTCLFEHRLCRIGLPVFTLLDLEIVLLADEILQFGQIGELRAQLFAVKVFANVVDEFIREEWQPWWDEFATLDRETFLERAYWLRVGINGFRSALEKQIARNGGT